MNKPTTKTAKELARGKWLSLVNREGWEYCSRVVGTGVVMIAAEFEGKLILVEQFRASVGRNVVELPAGIAGDLKGEESESFELAARRELLEEAGFEARSMIRVCEGPVSSGITDEVVTFFVARGLTRKGKGGGDATENIRVHEVPIREVFTWAAAREREGVYVDPKIFSGLCFALAEVEGKGSKS